MSTYVIGDVQGCYDELQQLLALVNFDSAQDELWLVGDLVCRGKDSLKVLAFLVDFPGRLRCVLGNHDLNLLAVAHGIRAPKEEDKIEDVLLSDDWLRYEAWLRALPLLHYDADLNVIMTHAGLYPFWSIQQAMVYALEVEALLRGDNYLELLTNMYGDTPLFWSEDLRDAERYRFIINAFTRMRVLTLEGAMNLSFNRSIKEMPADLKPWFNFVNESLQETKVVFGHWAGLQGVTGMPQIQAVDTGCAWGNALTALRLEDNQRFSIPCRALFI